MYWVKFFGKYLLSLLFMLVFVSTPAIIALISKNILLKIICFIISGTVFVFWIKWLMISSEKHAKDRKLGIYADDYDETRTFAYKLRKYSGLSKIKYNTFNFIFMLLNSLWVGLVLFGNPINFFPIEFIFGMFVGIYPFIPISILVAYNKGWSKDVEFSFINKLSIIIEIIGAWGLIMFIPMAIRSLFIISKNSSYGVSFLDAFHYGYFAGLAGVSLCYILVARLIQVFLKIEENTRTSNESSKEKKIVKENTESNTDNYEELEKLYELKEKGIITDEEFEKKKKEILGL